MARGLCFRDGLNHCEPNRARAFQLFFKEATRSKSVNFEAQQLVALHLRYGWGVDKDKAESMNFLQLAAGQGCVVSMMDLVALYESQICENTEWDQNELKSWALLKRLEKQKYFRAMTHLEKPQYFKYQRIEKCQRMVLLLLLNLKFERYSNVFIIFPRDIVIMIAKVVWKTRFDIAWMN